MKTTSVWSDRKIANIAAKNGVDTVYYCRKNNCDALAVPIDGLLIIQTGSRVAPTDEAFNAKFSLPQDMRRVAEKFNRIKDGVIKRVFRFVSFARAAQFVSAKHNARAKDWKKIVVKSVSE